MRPRPAEIKTPHRERQSAGSGVLQPALAAAAKARWSTPIAQACRCCSISGLKATKSSRSAWPGVFSPSATGHWRKGPYAVTLKLREGGAYQERKDGPNRHWRSFRERSAQPWRSTLLSRPPIRRRTVRFTVSCVAPRTSAISSSTMERSSIPSAPCLHAVPAIRAFRTPIPSGVNDRHRPHRPARHVPVRRVLQGCRGKRLQLGAHLDVFMVGIAGMAPRLARLPGRRPLQSAQRLAHRPSARRRPSAWA